MRNIKSKVKELIKQNPNGFTYNPNTNKLENRGYVVATIETQNCFGESGLEKVIKYCKKHKDYCIGGWRNEDGVMQYDASKVYDNIYDARTFAIYNKQRAFFDLNKCVEIAIPTYQISSNQNKLHFFEK